jgi:predicted phage terminase large subunit-like protein
MELTDDEIFLELGRRHKARSSMEDFSDWMRPSGHSDFQYPYVAHQKVIVAALEQIIRNPGSKVMIQCPPGSSKSYLLKQLTMLYWALNPEANILRISSTTALSERFARSLRSCLAEPLYKLISGFGLDTNQQSISSFANSKGGTVTSAGMGSSIVGLRADLAIIDDPIASWEQAHSDTQLDAQIQWYWSEYRSRLKGGGGSSEILVMTRWSARDIAAHLLETEPEAWTILRMPLICDDPENDPLQRPLNGVLWPEYYHPKMVSDAQRDPEIFSGLYQQIPLQQEGDFLNADDFEIVDKIPSGSARYASIDLALTEKQSADATVILHAAFAPAGDLILTDMWSDRCTPDATVQQLVIENNKHNPREFLIENSPAEITFKNLAYKMLRQLGSPVPFVEMKTGGRDKVSRAQTFRGLAKMGQVKLLRGPWNAELIRQCTEFPFGKHDDILDCCAMLGNRAAKMSAKQPSQERRLEAQEIKTKMRQNGMTIETTQTLDELFKDNERSNHNWRDQVIRL